MAENAFKENVGSLKISEEVIASVAGFAAAEVEGVASVAQDNSNLKNFLSKNFLRPITIELSDDTATVSMNITVKYGFNVSDTAEKVQNNVKSAIQNMTGVTVTRVNINITGICFEDKITD